MVSKTGKKLGVNKMFPLQENPKVDGDDGDDDGDGGGDGEDGNDSNDACDDNAGEDELLS